MQGQEARRRVRTQMEAINDLAIELCAGCRRLRVELIGEEPEGESRVCGTSGSVADLLDLSIGQLTAAKHELTRVLAELVRDQDGPATAPSRL